MNINTMKENIDALWTSSDLHLKHVAISLMSHFPEIYPERLRNLRSFFEITGAKDISVLHTGRAIFYRALKKIDIKDLYQIIKGCDFFESFDFNSQLENFMQDLPFREFFKFILYSVGYSKLTHEQMWDILKYKPNGHYLFRVEGIKIDDKGDLIFKLCILNSYKKVVPLNQYNIVMRYEMTLDKIKDIHNVMDFKVHEIITKFNCSL